MEQIYYQIQYCNVYHAIVVCNNYSIKKMLFFLLTFFFFFFSSLFSTSFCGWQMRKWLKYMYEKWDSYNLDTNEKKCTWNLSPTPTFLNMTWTQYTGIPRSENAIKSVQYLIYLVDLTNDTIFLLLLQLIWNKKKKQKKKNKKLLSLVHLKIWVTLQA